jgi:Ca2+-binding RTX toxin-like protein
MRRTIGLTALLVTIVVMGLFPPASAGVAVTCAHSGTTLDVDIALETARLVIVRSGADIQVIDRGTILTCAGGTSTVTNTDSVNVDDNSSGSPRVTISLAGGPFAPGIAKEASPEIEFNVDLGTGSLADAFTIRGSAGSDHIGLGLFGAGGAFANLNANEAVGRDADVTFGNADIVTVRGGGGADTISGRNAPEFDGPFPDPLGIRGGGGPDVLKGGTGENAIRGQGESDLMVGGAERDVIRGGDGGDQAAARAGRDSVRGDAGHDDLKGERGADHLAGGTGNDDLDGGPGTDTCAGGTGQDQLVSCEL